jgi:hypothetical protein
MTEPVFVEIVNRTTGEVARRIGPLTRRRAEKVERGASINLDHAGWFTRVVNQSGSEADEDTE